MQYFEHSTHAADDDAIMALRLTCGGAAVDAYWALLEKMYRDEGPLSMPACLPENDAETDAETDTETKSVSHRLNISENTLKTYVVKMVDLGLFEIDGGKLVSERAIGNIEAYQRKAKTARQNGKSGGRKPKRKPKGNQVGSIVGTDEETDSVTTKQNKTKGIGLDKTKPIPTASDGAAVAGATPPSAMQCPRCGSGMIGTGSHKGDMRLFLCPDCAEEAWA